MRKTIKIGIVICMTIAFLTPASLVVADSLPPIVFVMYPNGGEVVSGVITILWTAHDNETTNLNGTIRIEYSPNNGSSWTQIASALNNTGFYQWNTASVPDGNQYLIRVNATDAFNNTGSDRSNSTFSIHNEPPVVLVIYPNGGETVSGAISILWSAYDNETTVLNGTIRIEYSPNNGSSWISIASNLNNTGIYPWNTTTVSNGNQYLIRVSATDEMNHTGSDTSNTTFSIINLANWPPSSPQVVGPYVGGNGIRFNFTATTTDPEGDQLYYLFDWGDGNDSGWLGPVNSSESVTTSYAWRDDRNYSVRVKAKDIYEGESNWSVEHMLVIAEHINFSNVQLGYIYFKLFSFNKSFIFSDFLARLSMVIILTSHTLELKAYATEIVDKVVFKAENQMQIENMEFTDDNRSDGFSCDMNVSRGIYVLNITAFDANGSLIDHYSLFTVFFIRIGRYAMGPTGNNRLLQLRSIHPFRQ